MEHVPIDLSSAVPLEFRPDIGKVLAAFREAGAEIAADGEVHFQTHATSPATLRLAEPD
ncbi:MAG TPA: hypothetical protein VLI39_18565 [Sedimentisphaerales bacterium]|nr:hypothetical protein [Sedimentisphaerales bacterium]